MIIFFKSQQFLLYIQVLDAVFYQIYATYCILSLSQLKDASLRYTHNTMNMESSNVILNDGKWHHVEITWSTSSVSMTIDHVYKIGMNLTGGIVAEESLTQITLGDSDKSGNGFIGCIKGAFSWLFHCSTLKGIWPLRVCRYL